MTSRGRLAAYEIPPQLPFFADRKHERALARRAAEGWSEPSRPLCVSVSGIAGIGKTELACQLIRELQSRFPDGVLYVNLDDARVTGAVDPMDSVGSLLRRLDVTPEWSGHSADDYRKRYLTVTKGLEFALIIDNARYESEVAPLLPVSGASVVVITSHAPLAGMEGGAAVEIPLAPLGEQDVTELLQNLIGNRRLDTDRETTLELVRLCDGLPLAIHVAARLVRKHRRRSLRALLGEFRSTLQEKGLPKVETIWEAAYHSLSPEGACLYRLLADAPGPTFTPYSSAALFGGERDIADTALDELEAAGLVATVTDDFGNERLRLPEPLRAHARRRARLDGDRGELAEALYRIVCWYLRQAQLADERAAGPRLTLAEPVPELPGVEDMPFDNAFQWLESERHALYACVALAKAHGFDTEAWALCEPLWTHYLDYPHYVDVIEAFRTGLAAAQRAGDVPAVVRMRCQLARPHWDQSRFEEAERELKQALTASQALSDSEEDRKLKASAIEFRGRLRGAEGEWNAAVPDFKDALRIHEEIKNPYGVMLQTYHLGKAMAELGDAAGAAELFEQASLLATRENRPRMIARTGFALASVLHKLGRTARARELYLDSLNRARERGSEFDQARVLDALAALADDTGNTAEARTYREEADDLRARNGVGSS